MRLSEIAGRLSDEYVERIMGSPVWSLPCRTTGQEDWTRIISNPACVSEALKRLSTCGRDTLAVILRQFGPYSFEEDKLLALISKTGCWSGMEIRLALGELAGSGIVFAVRKAWGETLFFLPKDVFPIWLHAALPANLTGLTEAAAEFVVTSEELRPSFGLQLFGFLAVLARCGIAYTSKGVIGKRTVVKASERLSLRETDLSVLQLSYAYKEHYPLQTAIALDLVIGLGIVSETEDRLVWNAEELRRWLALPSGLREQQLIVRISGKLAEAAPGLIHAAAALLALEGGRWYRCADLDAWLRQDISAEAVQQWRGWLRVLSGFGWIQLGGTEDGTEVFRWVCDPNGSSGGAEAELPEPIRVLPSGDILVPVEADFRIRWELEVMAELESMDWMATYKVCAESLTRAVENGRSPETLIGRLEQASGAPLPETVVSTIRDWAMRACRVSFSEVLLLRCDTAVIAEQAAGNPRLMPLLGQKLGDCHYIVQKKSLPELRRLLQHAGYPPRIRIEGAAEGDFDALIPLAADAGPEGANLQPPNSAELAAGTKGLLYEQGSLRPYALTEEPYSPAEMYKEFVREVPAAWVNRLAVYHSSTKRDVMEKAIDWKVPVKLAYGGREIEFLPERLKSAAASWEVEGRDRSDSDSAKKLCLTPEMWGEMRMLFPIPERK